MDNIHYITHRKYWAHNHCKIITEYFGKIGQYESMKILNNCGVCIV